MFLNGGNMNLFDQIKMRTNSVLRMDKARQETYVSEQLKSDLEMVLSSYFKLKEKPHIVVEVAQHNGYNIYIEGIASEMRHI